MSLSALIRKREPVAFATATPATFATHQAKLQPTVASVATVAVAIPREDQTEPALASFRWLIHFTDREPLEVTFSPMVSHAGALACYPDAVAAEPMAQHPKRTATQTGAEELRQLVAAIYAEDTEADQAEALNFALADPGDALICYRAIALERDIFLNGKD